MFKIDYRIVTLGTDDIDNISETEIHYDFLQGSVWLISEEKSIVIDWEWIPLLDFAICLLTISNHLKSKIHYREQFEFTESDATIDFSRKGQYVQISTSFCDTTLNILFSDFEDEVRKFNLSLSGHIRDKLKHKKPNSFLRKYLIE